MNQRRSRHAASTAIACLALTAVTGVGVVWRSRWGPPAPAAAPARTTAAAIPRTESRAAAAGTDGSTEPSANSAPSRSTATATATASATAAPVASPTTDAPEALPRLRATYEASTDPLARQRALTEAARLATPDALEWLATVASRDADMAPHAARALASVTDPRLAPDLRRLATSREPVLVRANAIRALGASNAQETHDVLTRIARGADEPLRVRQESALALGHLGTPDAVRALAALLDEIAAAAPAQLRLSVIDALGAAGGRDARAALERHRGRTRDATERAFIERGLAR